MTRRSLLPLLVLSLTLPLAACGPRPSAAPESAQAVPEVLSPSDPASAAATTPSPTSEHAMDESQCDADAARSAIGKTATGEVIEQARTAAGARIARTLKPDQMVTMEYHPSRLNIDVDERNVITNVRCG